MNRETKIGLLVGLAFVIVIGILISDHLSNTNEPAGAPLRVAAENLRSSLGQQGGDVAPPLQVPATISPRQPVVTAEELNRRNTQPPIVFVNPPVTPTPPVTLPTNNIDKLRVIARLNNEDLIHPNDNSAGPPSNQPQPPALKSVARTYQAQPGDSLGAIARKVYGSGSKANRDAIIAANPDLVDNGDLIVAGRNYVIPVLSGGPAVPTTPIHNAEPSQATVTYVVKSRDTLWSIATSEVGTANAVMAIKDLNKDLLNGSDRVRPNMKLKLPARQVASSN